MNLDAAIHGDDSATNVYSRGQKKEATLVVIPTHIIVEK